MTRSALSASPLSDLHVIASEIGLDGYRRLRKADLVDAILERRGGDSGDDGAGDADNGEKRTRTRSRRSRSTVAKESQADNDATDATDATDDADAQDDEAAEAERGTRSRSRRTRSRRRDSGSEPAARGRSDDDRGAEDASADDSASEAEIVEGVVELQSGGTGFVRTDGDADDVYLSAAQIRRCELVDGDRISGPVRPPRRSERHPSLTRIDTVNGRSADEVADGTPFEELPCELPSERFTLTGGDATDVTLDAIERLTPIGRGSRVTISGPALSGKSEALRRIAAALNAQEGVDVAVVLSGVRPEEVAVWRGDGLEPAVVQALGTSADVRGNAIERALDTARRIAARGSDAVLAIDTIEGLGAPLTARVLGAARNITDGGSLTVIATAATPQGGETTMIVLDGDRAAAGLLPAIDNHESGTLRPELLVGDDGAAAIAAARTRG